MSKLKNFIKDAMTLPKGMAVPFKYMFKKPATVQYPEERKNISPRFRGLLINNIPQCIVCDLCSKACPVQCIKIEKTRGEDKKFVALKYDIDISTCLFCGLCTEACPTGSLSMEGGYEGTVYHKEELVAHFVVKTSETETMVFSKAEGWITYERARELAAIEEAKKKAAAPPKPAAPPPPAPSASAPAPQAEPPATPKEN